MECLHILREVLKMRNMYIQLDNSVTHFMAVQCIQLWFILISNDALSFRHILSKTWNVKYEVR